MVTLGFYFIMSTLSKQRLIYCSATSRFCSHVKLKNTKKYSESILLPRTKFPLRLDGKKKILQEQEIREVCGFAELYSWQRKFMNGPEYILHDGPPYANGDPHMGHAVNKILKDITIRNKLIQGHKVHYIPGWDCHGLPIELKALSDVGRSALEMPAVEIRKKARKYAEETIEKQKRVFQSWGVMADWDQCYHTFDKGYVKNQLLKFYTLFEKGLVYRDVKPVYWSPSSRTALAEAELEYNPSHHSTSVYVRFKLMTLPDTAALQGTNVYALIWTTTPWTLPANQAVCFNPDTEYSFVSLGDSNDTYLVASHLCDELKAKLRRDLTVTSTISGDLLNGITYRHPFFQDRTQRFVPGKHVTLTKGTGLVHTAPAHGPDDFKIALEHHMPIECIIGEDGCYLEEAGPLLENLSVLDKGNEKVLQTLSDDIVLTEDYVHSYPYDWRTKKPVILRACLQWFIDTTSIKNRAIESLSSVEILPNTVDAGLVTQLQNRPYWCISRQRVWGVPIPVFYARDTGKAILTKSSISHLCKLLDKYGTDFWWTLPVKELVNEEVCKESGISASDFEKGEDILDIWFDSGLSWSSVLQEKVADLYLEGLDQFTGWFQSSLLTSVALREQPPYRKVFVHGFTLDEKGRKMSKSLGNVVNPKEVVEGGKDLKKQPAFGVDVLRWWVASHAVQHTNITVVPSVLQESADNVHKIRIILRFILGSLHDYVPNSKTSSETSLQILDAYMLHLLWNFYHQVINHYNGFQYNKVCQAAVNFVTSDVSAFYCHVIKDRLYCDPAGSRGRLSCQYTLNNIFQVVTWCLGPIIPHLVEEAFLHYPVKKEDEKSLFRTKGPIIDSGWKQPEIANVMDAALQVKDMVNKLAPATNTLEYDALIFATGSLCEKLKVLQPEEESTSSALVEILNVSGAKVVESNDESHPENFKVEIRQASRQKCERCRRFTAADSDVCERCSNVLSSLV